MSTLQLWLLGIAAALTFRRLSWDTWFCHWHVGFGAGLDWKKKDGTVWISSRLIGYPLAKKGVRHPCRLVSINSHAMKFPSGEDFVSWMKEHKPRLGHEESWVIEKEGGGTVEVRMKPTLVTTSIPVRWDPNREPPTKEETEEANQAALNYRRDPNFKTWPVFCAKTGDFIGIRGSLSAEAIMGIIQ